MDGSCHWCSVALTEALLNQGRSELLEPGPGLIGAGELLRPGRCRGPRWSPPTCARCSHGQERRHLLVARPRLAVLKAAAPFGASRPDLTSAQVPQVADHCYSGSTRREGV